MRLSQAARHPSLGREIRTDVCELQLYECSSKATAMAIALALPTLKLPFPFRVQYSVRSRQ